MKRLCEVCGTDDTAKWYRNKETSGFLCAKDYRKQRYRKNQEHEKDYSKKYYRGRKGNTIKLPSNNPTEVMISKPEKRSILYTKDVCWQYSVRQHYLKEDMTILGLTKLPSLSEFSFKVGGDYHTVKPFITKYEWLGTMPSSVLYTFTTYYKNHLAGVVLISPPYSPSHLLGECNKDLEVVISRGAVASWAPKNLNSKLVMFAIRWLVKNTHYRMFSAYSDPEARELGTIYQACNFIYLGKTAGATWKYFDPVNPSLGWFTSRRFRSKKYWQILANELGIIWQKEWSPSQALNHSLIPADTRSHLIHAEKAMKARCKVKPQVSKHKYTLIQGADKRETKFYKKLFKNLNPLMKLPYPKTR